MEAESELIDGGKYTDPLEELPPSRWRSLGKVLDYAGWIDRERFAELDNIIAALPIHPCTENSPRGVKVIRRGRNAARLAGRASVLRG